MPRKLSEIKEFVSKKSLESIQADPAQNSVLGNAKMLYDALEAYEEKNGVVVNALRNNLKNILDAREGTLDEKSGDLNIDVLYGPLHTLHMLNGTGKMEPDEKKRKDLQNLIEYVAGGFDLEGKIPVSEKQKKDIERMEAAGRAEVRSERVKAEEQARRDAINGKSALNILDEHKAEINALPKRFSGAGAAIQEAAARQKLKRLCLDIMATRRSVEAKRNDKSGLAKAAVDADLLHSIRQDITGNRTIGDFLDSMSYDELRKLAGSGHGGAMEEKLADHLRKDVMSIPADAPHAYMPTAKERIEALQAKINSPSFEKQTPPGDQRKLYIELMATRAAVNSRRGDKSTLNRKVSAQFLEQERQKFSQEPLKTALVRATAMGDAQEASYKAALDGHGGALEDRVRRELRAMALERDNGCKMQSVDPRYAPTFDERRHDLDLIINSQRTSPAEKMRASVERGILDEMQENRGGDERIGNIESVNRQTDDRVALYSKMMDAQAMTDFVANAKTVGYDAACSRFEAAHMGELKAINLAEKLDSQLAAGPEIEELQKLAAQKMILLQHKTQFRKDKDNDKLADALDKAQMEKSINKLMNDHLFKEVCEKLGPEGLLQQAKGDGSQLVRSYGLAMEDKLQPYKPEPAASKNGPQAEAVKEEQPGGPQL